MSGTEHHIDTTPAQDELAHSPAGGGEDLRRRAQGLRTEELMENLAVLEPDVARWADSFIFGDVWKRPGLAFEDRMLVAIVALAATGQQAQLRAYLHGALQDGIEPDRIHEGLTMLVIYVGFPRALDALGTWRRVLASHERNVPPPQSPEQSPPA